MALHYGRVGEVVGELPHQPFELRAGFLAWTQTLERLIAPREPDRQLYYESWHAEWTAFNDILYLSLCVKGGISKGAEWRVGEGGRGMAGGKKYWWFHVWSWCRRGNKKGLHRTSLFCSLSSLNECQSRQGGLWPLTAQFSWPVVSCGLHLLGVSQIRKEGPSPL